MSEHLDKAVEIIGDMINIAKGQPAEESPKLYPLDQSEIVREIEVVYSDDSKLSLYHKLKWPTLEKLIEREQQTPEEAETLTANRRRVHSADGITANARLWDKFAAGVKGYGLGDIDPDQWTPITDELRTEIPSEHKSEAIVGLFAATFEVERPEGRGFVLGSQTYKVKQTYGPYTFYHVFSKPSEKDRRELSRKAHETQYQTGSVKVKSQTYTHLKPYVELYDRLFLRLEGVKGEGENISTRKDLINAIWKQAAIAELMEGFAATRRDLSKN